MYIYDKRLSDSQYQARNDSGASLLSLGNFSYPDRLARSLFGEGVGSFSPACDSTVATPAFSATEKSKLTKLLSVKESTQVIKWNRERHPGKSGIRPEDIVTDLARYVDFAVVRAAIQNSGGAYTISAGDIDAVCVEAAHQFQSKVYFQADEQTGGVGPSTLDSLGIVKHKLKPKIGNVYGRGVIKNISDKISTQTNSEFNAKNWFDFIVAPGFLGHRINRQQQGIHLLLLRKLREAENYLLSLPAYSGMTPVSLGRTLGLDRTTVRYSAGRISSEDQAMHGVGLAIDIDVTGNPWVGAGWIKDDKAGRDWLVDQIKNNPDPKLKSKYQSILNKRNERYRFLDTLRLAAGGSLNNVPRGTIASFLHALAVSHGRDTRAAHESLSLRNQEFKTYLRNNVSELRHWNSSGTFDNRDPLNGFLNLHADLVFALRQTALLAWGAIDFGPSASGDVMHFDLRTLGAGRVIAEKLGGYVPKTGHHPVG
jgi:hypothetical protein